MAPTRKFFMENVSDIIIDNETVTVIREQRWDAEAIREAISSLPYNGEGMVRDQLVEDARLPHMIGIFYQMVVEKGMIPTEEEFFTRYLDTFFVPCAGGFMLPDREDVYSREGLRGRVLRSYPSLIRDFHFFVLCVESKEFTNVRYSLQTDYYEGIDLIVTRKGRSYALALYVKTNRGTEFKQKKLYRHDKVTMKEIPVELDRDDCYTAGRFFLYDSRHVAHVITEIRKLERRGLTPPA